MELKQLFSEKFYVIFFLGGGHLCDDQCHQNGGTCTQELGGNKWHCRCPKGRDGPNCEVEVYRKHYVNFVQSNLLHVLKMYARGSLLYTYGIHDYTVILVSKSHL